jgi:restriction system protein
MPRIVSDGNTWCEWFLFELIRIRYFMAIPSYQTCMLPLLRLYRDGREHRLKDAVAILAKEFSLTEEERNECLPSGQQPVFANRVAWAGTYLKKAGLLSSPRRGYFRITERGQSVLDEKPNRITQKYLKQYPEFETFLGLRREKNKESTVPTETVSGEDLRETLEIVHEQFCTELANEMLTLIRKGDSALLEKTVGAILSEIHKYYIGLHNVYVQAKHGDVIIGLPEAQKFEEVLQGSSARVGIFITTSDFTKEASDFVAGLDRLIILLNGVKLTRLMIDLEIGVYPVATYKVHQINSDYFADE